MEVGVYGCIGDDEVVIYYCVVCNDAVFDADMMPNHGVSPNDSACYNCVWSDGCVSPDYGVGYSCVWVDDTCGVYAGLCFSY